MGSTIEHLINTPLGDMTRKQAAVCFSIPYPSLIRRMKDWPPERWFEPVNTRFASEAKPKNTTGSFATPYGFLSIPLLAQRLGFTCGAIRSRLYLMGWTIEDAINTPYRGRRGIDFILPPDEYARRLREVRANEPARREQHARATRERERVARAERHRRATVRRMLRVHIEPVGSSHGVLQE